MRTQLSNRDYEQLSAYMDGQLAPHEQRRFEERLHTHPDLQAALDEMTRTRTMLRQVPRRRAPRNFTLTPAMVGAQKPRRGFSLNLFPALSFASALATLVLVATIAFQLLPGTPVGMSTTAAEPASAPESAQSLRAAATPEATTAAAIMAAPQNAAPQGTALPKAAAPAAGAAPAPDQSSAGAADASAGAPIINWSVGGRGGGGGGGAATGMGGGGQGPYIGDLLGPPAANNSNTAPVYGMGGMGGGGVVSGPNMVIPPESANSLPPAAQAQAAPAQPDAKITGGGPILGVPSKAEGGQIIDRKLIEGDPSQAQPNSAAPNRDAAGQPSADLLFGLPRLIAIQALLALIAIITGIAAFIIRRRA